jgi:hypothetical protein
MKTTYAVAAVLLCAISSASPACTLPPLIAIPAKDKVGDQGPAIREAANQYRDGMQAYTDCVKAELEAAGGVDRAPTLMKALLIARNNAAVSEVEAVRKLLDANVGLVAVPASTFNQEQSKKDEKSK